MKFYLIWDKTQQRYLENKMSRVPRIYSSVGNARNAAAQLVPKTTGGRQYISTVSENGRQTVRRNPDFHRYTEEEREELRGTMFEVHVYSQDEYEVV